MAIDAIELEECPFCGNPEVCVRDVYGELYDSGLAWRVQCTVCNCAGPMTNTSAVDAAKAWNERVSCALKDEVQAHFEWIRLFPLFPSYHPNK